MRLVKDFNGTLIVAVLIKVGITVERLMEGKI